MMQMKSFSKKNLTVNTDKDKSEQNNTNPLGINFKGSIVTADVFEKAQWSISGDKVIQKIGTLLNNIVDKLNSLDKMLQKNVNSAIALRNDLKETGADIMSFFRESKIVFDTEEENGLIKLELANMSYSVKNLKKRSVSDLKAELIELLAAKGE